MSVKVDQKEGIPLPIWVGSGLTLLLIGGVVLSGFGSVCDDSGSCLSRWQILQNAPSNEIGDTLSGIGSALAFIWLVMTAWMQSQELREQRKELRQQRKEWEKISAAQDAQVEILERQGDIFADEMKHRSEIRARDELGERILHIHEILMNIDSISFWYWDKYEKSGMDHFLSFFISFVNVSGSADDIFLILANRIDEAIQGIDIRDVTFHADADFFEAQRKVGEFKEILDQVALLKNQLSADQLVRLKRLGFGRCRDAIDRLEFAMKSNDLSVRQLRSI